ncbi:MAG: ATP-binding protein [Planctomycetes bacterium]|nr:ATP-binding protein [Planctomycetota bacterium]
MTVDKLLRKLEPLIPEEVATWRRALPMLKDETRKLVERQIRVRAQRLLGASDRLLLPPPSEQASKGMFNLGTVLYTKALWPFGLTAGELLQHVAIFGRSGAGKTNLVFHLLEQVIERRVPLLFLDWKRTARHLLPRLKRGVHVFTPGRSINPFPFNPLIPPPGMERHLYIQQLLDILGSAYTLGDGAKSLLLQAIESAARATESATFADVLKALEGQDVHGRAHGWHASAVRALRSLTFGDLLTTREEDQRSLVHQLLHGNSVVELNGLNENAKAFLIPMLLLWLYQSRLGSTDREQLRLVVVIEEAHHVFYGERLRAQESVMERLLRQCRELGIACIIVDQHPHLISSAALGNCFTTVCMNLKDPRDINRAAALCLLEDEDKEGLSTLAVGQAVVKLQDRWHHPFLIQVPLMQVEKGAVTDDRLRDLMASKPGSGGSRLPVVVPGEVRQVRLSDLGRAPDALRLLQDVVDHPHDGVKARYRQLAVSVDRGNRWKRLLLEAGFLETATANLGRTRRALLRPSPAARKLLGLAPGIRHESLLHEFWKHYHARVFQDRGYQVEIEAPRPSGKGRVDVLARRGEETVAIEIETGMSDVVANVRADLAAGLRRVIVVASDRQVLHKLTVQLAAARLALPGRVSPQLPW